MRKLRSGEGYLRPNVDENHGSLTGALPQKRKDQIEKHLYTRCDRVSFDCHIRQLIRERKVQRQAKNMLKSMLEKYDAKPQEQVSR